MHFSTKIPSADAPNKLLSSLRSRLMQHDDNAPEQPIRRLSIPYLDASGEQLFRQSNQASAINTLKKALLLSITYFLGILVVELFSKGLSTAEIIGYLAIALILGLLFLNLPQRPDPKPQIIPLTKLCIALAISVLSAILLIEHNPALYTKIWIGILPIYCLIYGTMLISAAETLELGLLAMIALPLCGYLIGVGTEAMLASIMILLLANAFGFCTRCQRESHDRRLFRERREAEYLLEQKTLFLKQLSHNLRQPLQALSCYTSVLDNTFANRFGDPLQQTVCKLGSAVDELNNTFNRIFDIANLETGQQIQRLSAIDINLLLIALENQFAPLAAKQGLKLKVRLRSRPPYTVYSDACILSQIISNLIDNAIKYTVSGWILITAIKVESKQLKLHIYDTGIGIADNLHSEIFKEFFRCPRRRTDTPAHGLGIGLAYALKATQCLPNHNLQVHSRLNQGSDFQLSLPVIDSASQQASATHLPTDFAGCFVFIVDTDHQLLLALSEQLTAWGCLVQTATCKTETYASLAENLRPPDLLITDFYLDHQETAHDIIAAIQADCDRIPTLILSAHAIPDADKAKWPDNTLLLRKPASGAVLLEMMARALGKGDMVEPTKAWTTENTKNREKAHERH